MKAAPQTFQKRTPHHPTTFRCEEKVGRVPSLLILTTIVGNFLLCSREREAVQEGYNLLNEYADKLYGPEAKKVYGIVTCRVLERLY